MKASIAHVLICVMVVGLLGGTADAVNIVTVPVGNAGNAPDTRYGGYGAVGYSYQISKFEITAGQYCEFLNAVAKTDSYGLYTGYMGNQRAAGIGRSGTSGTYSYNVASVWANQPVGGVTFGQAARFCNWLTNNQPNTGVQNAATTEDGSYALNGVNDDVSLASVTRKANAKWVIPNENEWYKAAYYDPNKVGGAGYWDYPTRTNETPITDLGNPGLANNANTNNINGYPNREEKYYRTDVGLFTNSASPYGTFDQGGNVWEWYEKTEAPASNHGIRGGCFSGMRIQLRADFRGDAYPPTNQSDNIGFRVVEVPEPASLALLAFGGLTIIRRKRR